MSVGYFSRVWEILLVGIDYDKKTREHQCVVESLVFERGESLCYQ